MKRAWFSDWREAHDYFVEKTNWWGTMYALNDQGEYEMLIA